jgi:AraC-like DNA-binding protein
LSTEPNLGESDGPVLANLIADLLSACIKPSHHRNEMEREALIKSKRMMVQSFIEANLRNPNLGPAMICEHCGLSQSRLYDLMAGQGGIAHYIWARRLERASDALRHPLTADQNISTVAEKFGFTRLSHFSAAFKREFGIGPRDWHRNMSSLPQEEPHGNLSRSSIYVRELIDQRLSA